LRPHFEHHGCWHKARQDFAYDLRKMFPGECGKHLHALNEPGSGCDFLHFHHSMVLNFRWILENVSGINYTYRPWPGKRLPHWTEELFRKYRPDFDLETAYTRIETLVCQDNVDALGAFIEANELAIGTGKGIHNKVHRVISQWEKELFGPDNPVDMGSMETAPGNVHFWDLHGWIDQFYIRWQFVHGCDPDLTPISPMHSHVHCDNPHAEVPE